MRKIVSWAIVATVERPNGTWYTDTILEIDDDTASSVDSFLTEYCKEQEPLILTKEMEVKDGR